VSKIFHIFKVTDKEWIDSIKSIAIDCNGAENVQTSIFLGEGHQQINLPINSLDEDQMVQQISSLNSSILFRISLSLSTIIKGASVKIERQAGSSDIATINFANDATPESVIMLLSSCAKHLRMYERTEETDKLLGDELAEFYRRREAGLLRLEELTQTLIRQNKEYRDNVDKEFLDLAKQLKNEILAKEEALKADFAKKEKHLEEQVKQFEERVKDFDIRDSRTARRQIRMDLKNELGNRNKSFSLTPSTRRKRWPIHALFGFLIIVTSLFFGRTFWDQLHPPENMDLWILMIRFSISAIALAATVIFYIRWNDLWFSKHADEEFKLKRLELDVDRASWVVEMANEWTDERGGQLPESLVACLSKNLFETEDKSIRASHPNEDLASALLGATSCLSLNIPGVGEASLNRRGVKDFRKAAASVTSEKQP